MAMKERIKNALELQTNHICESKSLTADEKMQLTELVSEAAECTNGYDEQEKVQRLAETTFHVTTALARVTQQLSENNALTKNLDGTLCEIGKKEAGRDASLKRIDGEVQKISAAVQQAAAGKRDIKNLSWKDTAKLVLVKPWVWVFLAFFVFSPKCLELLQIAMKKMGW